MDYKDLNTKQKHIYDKIDELYNYTNISLKEYIEVIYCILGKYIQMVITTITLK